MQRNRMKRRLREAVRLSQQSKSIAADVVINPKRALLTVDFKVLQGEIAAAFRAIGNSLAKGKRH